MTHTKKPTLIFDLDGTLIDSVEAHWDMIHDAAQRYGVEITQADRDKYNGMRVREALPLIKKEKGFKIGPFSILKEYLNAKRKIYQYIKIFPETIPTLKKLHSKKYSMAIATSSPKGYMRKNLKNYDIQKYFTHFTTGSELRKSKPDPEIFLKTAKKMKAEPSECIVIEDAVTGSLAAKRAGMRCIIILTTTPRKAFVNEAKPEMFIAHIGELPAAIKKLEQVHLE